MAALLHYQWLLPPVAFAGTCAVLVMALRTRRKPVQIRIKPKED
jgi:hypothetical protein